MHAPPPLTPYTPCTPRPPDPIHTMHPPCTPALPFPALPRQVPEYFGDWHPVWAILGSIILLLSTLVCNISANLLSPMNDLLNLAPSKFNFKYCGYACMAMAVAICPWWTFSSQVGGAGVQSGGWCRSGWCMSS